MYEHCRSLMELKLLTSMFKLILGQSENGNKWCGGSEHYLSHVNFRFYFFLCVILLASSNMSGSKAMEETVEYVNCGAHKQNT